MLQTGRRRIYVIMLFIILGTVVIAGSGCSNNVVARVNGDTITKDELYNRLVEQNGQTALDSLITDKIRAAEVKKNNISVSAKEIEQELNDLKTQYGGEEGFNEAIESYGMTLDDVKKDVKANLEIEKVIALGIDISEDEMKSYFEENKASFAQEEQVQVRHILVDSEKTAKEVKEKLSAGADFAEMAKKYSTDTGTKDAGGELGFISKGQMVAEFEKAAFSLEKGKISDPVKTEYGYHIINVESKKEAKAANYADSKAEIKETLLKQKVQTEYSTWLENKYKEYNVEDLLEEK